MANYNSLSALFTAIADNLRAKLGIDDDIVATDFPDKIAEIQSSASPIDGHFRFYYRAGEPISYFDPERGEVVRVLMPNEGYIDLPIPCISGYSAPYLTIYIQITGSHGFDYYGYGIKNSTIGGVTRADAVTSVDYGVLYPDGSFRAAVYLNLIVLHDGDIVRVSQGA